MIGPADGASADKFFFTEKIKTGFAGISDPATGESLTLRFPPEDVPYLALWINRGGFGDQSHVAIEPATAGKDALDLAILDNQAASIDPRGEYRWYLEIDIK